MDSDIDAAKSTNDEDLSAKRAKIVVLISAIIIALAGLVVMFLYFGTLNDNTSTVETPSSGGLIPISNDDYIYTKPINSIRLKFYLGYNIATGDAISNVVPAHVIELEGEELGVITRQIKSLKKVRYDKDSEAYSHLIHDHMVDMFELNINTDMTLYIGDEYGMVLGSYDYFEVPTYLYERIEGIAEDYCQKNVYQTIGGTQFSVTHDGEERVITDNEQKQTLSDYKYYAINDTEDSFVDERVAYIVKSDNGKTISVYYASVLSRIDYSDGKFEYIYTGGLEEYLDSLFED